MDMLQKCSVFMHQCELGSRQLDGLGDAVVSYLKTRGNKGMLSALILIGCKNAA
jgi:hypothetical protein